MNEGKPIMEWLNSKEERYNSLLEENAQRRNFLKEELSAIRELKKIVQGNTAETDRPET